MDNNSLHHIDPSKVIIKIDLEGKNSHTFEDGTKIIIERKYNNFNRRYTEAVNAEVISAENIPAGAEILIHHNSTHDTYRVFNYHDLSGEEVADTVKIFSIPLDQCFFYRQSPNDEWSPCGGFIRALRVFEPYKGLIQGVPATEIKKVLYILSGELQGKVCHTLHACDYCIVFMDKGRTSEMIRCRHFEGDELHEREEITAISDYLTEQLESGELLVGISPDDAKLLKDIE